MLYVTVRNNGRRIPVKGEKEAFWQSPLQSHDQGKCDFSVFKCAVMLTGCSGCMDAFQFVRDEAGPEGGTVL